MWSKNNRKKARLLLSAVLVLVALLIVLLIPYGKAKNTMDTDGKLSFLTMDDGTVQLQWPQGTNADGYEVQVLETDGQTFYSCRTTECTALLPQLPADREL